MTSSEDYTRRRRVYAARVAEVRTQAQRLATDIRAEIVAALDDLGPGVGDDPGPRPVGLEVAVVVRALIAEDVRATELTQARGRLDRLYVAAAPIRSADPEIRRLRRAEARAEAARRAST